MRTYLPAPTAHWTRPEAGVFNLDPDFYNRSGGILLPSAHYEEMFSKVRFG